MTKHISFPIAIIILFLLITILSIKINGVKVSNDSFRYLEYAENLREGFYVERHNVRYIMYVFFIYIVDFLPNDNLHFAIIFFQYLLSGISLIFLYKGLKILFRKEIVATIACVLCLLFLEFSFWNSYVLCESLYLSATSISIYFLIKACRSPKKINYVFLFSSCLFLAFVKPTGIAFGIALLIVIIFGLKKITSNLVYGLMIFGLVLSGFWVINKYLTTYQVIENYQMGEVISGVTTVSHLEGVSYYILDVPEDLEFLGENNPPLLRIAHFALHNFSYWLKLSATKMLFFVAHIRPLWSFVHNVYNGLLLLICYFFFFRSFCNRTISQKIKVFAGSYFLIHLIGVGLTAADWDGRFLMPVLPILFAIAAFQIYYDMKCCFKKLRIPYPRLLKSY